MEKIIKELQQMIAEIKENSNHHSKDAKTNGEMICFGIQLAIEKIQELKESEVTK